MITNVQSNVYFGKKYSTRQILTFTSGIGIFNNNVKFVNRLANNKVDIINTSVTGCGMAFDYVVDKLKEQLPQLQSHIDRILRVPYKKGTQLYKKNLKTIMDAAVSELGKNIDVSTEEIETYLIRLCG